TSRRNVATGRDGATSLPAPRACSHGLKMFQLRMVFPRMFPLIAIVFFALPAFGQTNEDETANTNAVAKHWDAISTYRERTIEGWQVLVNDKLVAETNLCAQVLKILDAQLFQVTRVVPGPALAKIRQIPIWIELNDPLFPGSVYHESPDWLREHGVNPAKAGAVEIANAKNFTTWTIDQPWMVLHELAHGYQHLFLGDDNADIRRCYEHAKEKHLYDSVLRIDGRHERHYAMTNEKEYFAEMSEAFFGTNDFYPFVRAELREHDPETFATLCRLWGVKPQI
ncbi:MAG TPA: hypothetical protein VFV81_00840, partial [Verrucomicrobiae bacterium]|nr:hypothetical protein [Verrucomicrobiae bacterium]